MILIFDMGVGGAAIATVIGNLASVVYYAFYLIRGNSILSCNPKRFYAGDRIAANVIPIGVPAAINNILMSLSNIILNNLMKDYGEAAVAALGIAMKVNMLIVFVQMGMGMGIQPLIGYSFGAKNIKRLKGTIKFTILCTVIFGTILSVLYFIFTSSIINLFNGENDPLVTEYGVKILRALIITGPFIGIMFAFNFAFQGMGKPVPSLVLSLGRQGLIFLPVVIIMNRIFAFDGIIYAQPAADLICVVLSAIMFAVIVSKQKRAESPLKAE